MNSAALPALFAAPNMAAMKAFGRAIGPGVMLCLLVTLAAIGLTSIERDAIGHVWLEPLVLAILLGAAVRTAWTPDARFKAGIDFSAPPPCRHSASASSWASSPWSRSPSSLGSASAAPWA